MKIIIIGCGKVGRSAAAALSAENHDVVVIDSKPDRIFNLANEIDVMAVNGSGLSHEVLLEAGAANANLLIAVTGNDELNLLCCLLAKRLGVPDTIARVRNPEYTQYISELRADLGISMIVNPEQEAAFEIYRSLSLPQGVSSEMLSTRSAEIYKLKVTSESVLAGLQVKQIPSKLRSNVLVCMVERGMDVFIPDGEFTLHANDRISVMGDMRSMNNFFHVIRTHPSKIRSVMAVGAGKVAFYLANLLKNTPIQLTMVEADEKTCEYMAETFPDAIIIHGNGAEEDLLVDEGLCDMDAFVSLTGIDEENIILSLHAAKIAGIKTITKINRINFSEVLSSLDLDTIVNPKKLTLEKIIRYVRAASSGIGAPVESIHRLGSDKAEGLEFCIKENSAITNVPLQDLNLKSGTLLAMIVRGSQTILPRGNDVIRKGDRVIVITTNLGLSKIDQILETGARA